LRGASASPLLVKRRLLSSVSSGSPKSTLAAHRSRSCGVPWSFCLKKYERNRQCGYGVRKNRVHVKLANEIHTVGCLDKGFEFFKDNLLLIAGLAISFTLPLILGLLFTHILQNQIRKQLAVLNKQKVFI